MRTPLKAALGKALGVGVVFSLLLSGPACLGTAAAMGAGSDMKASAPGCCGHGSPGDRKGGSDQADCCALFPEIAAGYPEATAKTGALSRALPAAAPSPAPGAATVSAAHGRPLSSIRAPLRTPASCRAPPAA